MRWFFISVAILRMLYAADLFLVPGSGIGKGTKGFIRKLAKIQRQVMLHIMGTLRSTPIDVINTCMVSHINLAWNYIQLPTPCLSSYLNTNSLFVYGFPIFCPTIIIQTAFST